MNGGCFISDPRKSGILEVILKPKESPKKSNVILKRWIVARTLSWFENYRILTTSYEFITETAKVMVEIAFI